jgi:hypothetical protein
VESLTVAMVAAKVEAIVEVGHKDLMTIDSAHRGVPHHPAHS